MQSTLWHGVIILVMLLCVMPCQAAINLTATQGETWIKWQWDSGYNVSVYENGVFRANTTLNYISTTDTEAGEKYRITLYNQSDATELDELEVRTHSSSWIMYFILGLLSLFFLITLYLAPSEYCFIPGMLCLVGSFSMNIIGTMYSVMLSYVFTILGVLAFMVLIYALYVKIGDRFI